MPSGARKKNNAAIDRELAEIDELSKRVVDEAPTPGENLMDTDSAEISVQKTVFVKERKFADLAISQRTLLGSQRASGFA